ncbi:hypothetical protein X748_28120 [Mesorhizobium sp. LNJC386A00]|nr:hypothetical protein X752_26495 [Mesorhizobium sp. LNJC398B00]ESY28674.1 hypothetical protein X748_28120 [Mesorhizobium sp. LNJC386A00]
MLGKTSPNILSNRPGLHRSAVIRVQLAVHGLVHARAVGRRLRRQLVFGQRDPAVDWRRAISASKASCRSVIFR